MASLFFFYRTSEVHVTLPNGRAYTRTPSVLGLAWIKAWMRFFHVGPVQAIFSALRFHTQGLDQKNTHIHTQTGRPNIHLFKQFCVLSLSFSLMPFCSFSVSYPPISSLILSCISSSLSLFLHVSCSKLSKVGKSADLLTTAFERGPQKGDENRTEVHRMELRFFFSCSSPWTTQHCYIK